MKDNNGYAVFFFPNALETLGEAIKPYLQDGPAGAHVPCREVDTAGAFIKMTLQGKTTAGRDVFLELMVPNAMVRMVVSARSDDADDGFGFYDRNRPPTVTLEPGMTPVPQAANHDAVASGTPAPDAGVAPADSGQDAAKPPL